MTEVSQSDRDHAELLLLYSGSVAEIAGFKQQQWAVTYYTLLVQAGLVAAGQIIDQQRMHSNERFILGALVALSLVLGLMVLRTLQLSIKARRDRMANIRESFGEPFKTARSVSKENDPVPCILAIAQAAGAFVAGWLVVVWL